MSTSTYLLARSARVLLAAALLTGGLAACRHHDRDPATAKTAPCRRDTEDDVRNAGATGVEGVKAGASTVAETGKAVGRTTAGLVSGGTNEAGKRWDEGKENIGEAAHEGGAKTSDQANLPRCP